MKKETTQFDVEYEWVIDVICSCLTAKQLTNAVNLLLIFCHKYPEKNVGNRLYKRILAYDVALVAKNRNFPLAGNGHFIINALTGSS